MELVHGRGKVFCKNISGHVHSRFVFQLDGTLRNLMPNEWYLMSMCFMHQIAFISCKSNCTLIVFIDGCRVMKDEIEVMEKMSCLQYLACYF